MKRIFLLLGILLSTACSREGLRTGDLLFQAGESDFTEAITSVTDGIWSHVGIVEKTPESVFILEASPDCGVVRTPLSAFLDEAAHLSDGTPVVKACRIQGLTREEASSAIERAKGFLGRSYDFAFLPGMEEVYCSELVHACILKKDGTPLFEARPMTFCDSTGKTSPYWIQYYESLGTDIPEGVPGTNPNDLSRAPVLTPVKWTPRQ